MRNWNTGGDTERSVAAVAGPAKPAQSLGSQRPDWIQERSGHSLFRRRGELRSQFLPWGAGALASR